MFDLRTQIRAWREALMQREAFQESDVDELELHLRDETSRLAAKGLSEEEAFGVALRRLGDTDVLGAEFGKVNGGVVWGRRLQWMLAGYLVVTLSGRAILAVAQFFASMTVAGGMKGVPTVAAHVCAIVACALVLLYIAAKMRSHRATRARLFANRLHAWTKSPVGALTIMAIAFVVVVGIQILQFAPWLIMAHYLSLNEFGVIARDSRAVGAVGSVLGPLTVLGLILWIDRRSAGLAACQ